MMGRTSRVLCSLAVSPPPLSRIKPPLCIARAPRLPRRGVPDQQSSADGGRTPSLPYCEATALAPFLSSLAGLFEEDRAQRAWQRDSAARGPLAVFVRPPVRHLPAPLLFTSTPRSDHVRVHVRRPSNHRKHCVLCRRTSAKEGETEREQASERASERATRAVLPCVRRAAGTVAAAAAVVVAVAVLLSSEEWRRRREEEAAAVE